jgi:NADH-quinone oxidoreductase subunit I
MKIIRYFYNILKGLWSLIVGLKITGIEFFRPWLTVHYPRQEVINLDTFRGHIDLVPKDTNPTIPKCIMCRKCMEICPSRCIRIEMHVKGDEDYAQTKRSTIMVGQGIEIPFSGRKLPPAKSIKRELDTFYLNYNNCSLCGLCVQSCPVGALKFSRDAYLAGTSRKDFEFDLLQRLKSISSLSGSIGA